MFSSRTIIVRELHDYCTIIVLTNLTILISLVLAARLSYDYHTIIVRFLPIFLSFSLLFSVRQLYAYCTRIVRLLYTCCTLTPPIRVYYLYVSTQLSCPHVLDNTVGASTFHTTALMRRLVRGTVPSRLLCVMQGIIPQDCYGRWFGSRKLLHATCWTFRE